MTADPPGRAPNPAVWAVQRGDRWVLLKSIRDPDGSYAEHIQSQPITADAALAWLTDHRRRNPR